MTGGRDLCRALDPEHPERVVVGPVDFGCEIEGGGPHENDLSATALSADATPAPSAYVGPDAS